MSTQNPRVRTLATGCSGNVANAETAQAVFYRSRATYVVAPGATYEVLLDDAADLVGCARAVFLGDFESLSEVQWAGLTLLQQAEGALLAALERIPASGQPGPVDGAQVVRGAA